MMCACVKSPWLHTNFTKMANLSRTLSDASGSIYSDTSNPIPPDSLADMEDEAIKQLMEQLE